MLRRHSLSGQSSRHWWGRQNTFYLRTKACGATVGDDLYRLRQAQGVTLGGCGNRVQSPPGNRAGGRWAMTASSPHPARGPGRASGVARTGHWFSSVGRRVRTALPGRRGAAHLRRRPALQPDTPWRSRLLGGFDDSSQGSDVPSAAATGRPVGGVVQRLRPRPFTPEFTSLRLPSTAAIPEHGGGCCRPEPATFGQIRRATVARSWGGPSSARSCSAPSCPAAPRPRR